MDKKFKNILPHLDLLKAFCKCKKPLRNTIIQKGSKPFIGSICECAYNLLENNINLKPEDFQKIKKFKKPIRKLIKRTSLKDKKKILVQHGGFLEFLIPAAVTLISDLIGNAIKE